MIHKVNCLCGPCCDERDYFVMLDFLRSNYSRLVLATEGMSVAESTAMVPGTPDSMTAPRPFSPRGR